MPKIKNVNVRSIKKIIKPKSVINKLPLTNNLAKNILMWRKTISNIIAKKDKRLFNDYRTMFHS